LISEAWEAYSRDLILTRVQFRRRFGALDAALLTAAALDQLRTEMIRSIEVSNTARKQEFERGARAAGAAGPINANVINVDALTAMVRREVEKLKLEREIMTDGALRGEVLKKFYAVRNQPAILAPQNLPGIETLETDYNRLINICEQLGQHGLLQWVSANSLTSVGGMSRITARGVDVVEGTARASIAITFHDRRISVTGSSNVQIGDSNTITQSGFGIGTDDLKRLVTELVQHLAVLTDLLQMGPELLVV
jgi:hypothetical protein